MSILKTSYYAACSLLPMGLLKAIGPSTTLFPYHHTVSNDFLPHIKHLYNYKNEKQFAADLDLLLKHFRPVTLPDIIQSVQRSSILPKNSFLLSFDDGFREVHDIIAPILEKKGVPAFIFVNPAFIDNRELFYRSKISLLIDELLKNKEAVSHIRKLEGMPELQHQSPQQVISFLKAVTNKNAHILDSIACNLGVSFEEYLKKYQPFLTRVQVKSLHDRGFYIGAHSVDHPYFQTLSLEEQVAQVIKSCQYVNELLGTPGCCFSFPHSDLGISQELFDTLQPMDIPLLFGIQNQKTELKNKMVHRFNAERPEIKFSRQIKGLLLLLWLQNLRGRNQVNRKH